MRWLSEWGEASSVVRKCRTGGLLRRRAERNEDLSSRQRTFFVSEEGSLEFWIERLDIWETSVCYVGG